MTRQCIYSEKKVIADQNFAFTNNLRVAKLLQPMTGQSEQRVTVSNFVADLKCQ